MSEYICPHCKKSIYDDEALLCLYCGGSLGRSVGVMGKLRFAKPHIIIVGIVVLMLFSFMLLLMR